MSDEIKQAWENLKAVLPEWAVKDKSLRLISGKELVIEDSDRLRIKKVRCNQCGECCLDIPEGHLRFGTNGEGRCNMLANDFNCMAGHETPLSCVLDPNEKTKDKYNCSIEYF